MLHFKFETIILRIILKNSYLKGSKCLKPSRYNQSKYGEKHYHPQTGIYRDLLVSDFKIKSFFLFFFLVSLQKTI